MGFEKQIEGRECKPFTLVSPKFSVEVKSFYIKKIYINFMIFFVKVKMKCPA